MTTALAAILGYLAGSIPFAVLVSRAMRLPDPRTYGSGNIGATNVLRSGNRLAALLTMVGDIAKGWGAVLLAKALGLSEFDTVVVGFAAFVGHCFPVWLRFKGGKGVATAAGALIAIDWRIGLSVLAVWLAVAAATRYSSLAAMVGAVAAPFLAWQFLAHPGSVAMVAAMAVLLVVRHHANIAKLLRGEESRIGARKAPLADQQQP
jgi:acyl phosphate:glycerol-3-phosphate acyltransferase